MPNARPEHEHAPPWEAGAPPEGGDLLEGGTGPSWSHRLWTALSPVARGFLIAVGVLVLLGGGLVWLRDQAVEHELRQRVVLRSSIGVWSSSTSPPGGSVHYFLVVRNEGPRPVWIESLDATGNGLRLGLREPGDRRVAAGGDIALPLSVRLTCRDDAGEAEPGSPAAEPPGLAAELSVRREDGGSTAREVGLGAVRPLVDAVGTLCKVRPELVDRELSGPVLGGA